MAAQDAQTFNWYHAEFDNKHIHALGGGRALLLSVSFFFLLMFTLLYMIWVCRRGNGSAANSSSSSNGTVRRTGGLDPKTISSIPVRLHQASEGSEDAQCSICLVGFAEGDKVKALPRCNHEFHPACVDEWLRTQSSCPLCRGSLGGADAAAELELVLH